MPPPFQPIIEFDTIRPRVEKHPISQNMNKYKFNPETNENFRTYSDINMKLDSIKTSEKWSVMEDLVFHFKVINLERVKTLIVLIHNCSDAESSNHIYYTVHRSLLSEAALQTDEIIAASNLLKLNSGYVNSELKIITDLFEGLILTNTDDFSDDSNKEVSIRILLRIYRDITANYYNLSYDYKRELFRFKHIGFIKKQ